MAARRGCSRCPGLPVGFLGCRHAGGAHTLRGGLLGPSSQPLGCRLSTEDAEHSTSQAPKSTTKELCCLILCARRFVQCQRRRKRRRQQVFGNLHHLALLLSWRRQPGVRCVLVQWNRWTITACDAHVVLTCLLIRDRNARACACRFLLSGPY